MLSHKYFRRNKKLFLNKKIYFYRRGLTLADIMPEDIRLYDKMRPPKKEGQPTTVFFHVTVMGLDSIDETSMVNYLLMILFGNKSD